MYNTPYALYIYTYTYLRLYSWFLWSEPYMLHSSWISTSCQVSFNAAIGACAPWLVLAWPSFGLLTRPNKLMTSEYRALGDALGDACKIFQLVFHKPGCESSKGSGHINFLKFQSAFRELARHHGSNLNPKVWGYNWLNSDPWNSSGTRHQRPDIDSKISQFAVPWF